MRSFARYLLLSLLLLATCCTPAVAEASEMPGNRLFLTTSASNTHPFAGQEILLTYTLWFRDVAPKISSETNPSFTGLWAKESQPERFIKSMQKKVNGDELRSAVVKQFRVVPLQAGTFTIAGYVMQCILPQQQIATNLKEIPETFVRITAPPIILSSLALPEPVPEGFSGGVGAFTLDLRSDNQKIRVGEPLTLKLIVTGTGNLHTLQLPGPTLPESFRHNPPERTTSPGSITSTITAWPQVTGSFKIPALRLVVFNPETRKFSTLVSKALTITVEEGPFQGKIGQEAEHPAAAEGKNNFSVPATGAIIAILFLLTIIAMALKGKKLQQSSRATTSEHQPEGDASAETMKQQLFTLLETAGIRTPEAMTRKELERALQELTIPVESQSELSAVLDSLDKILYCPSGKNGSPIPASIVAKVNALLTLLKTVERCR